MKKHSSIFFLYLNICVFILKWFHYTAKIKAGCLFLMKTTQSSKGIWLSVCIYVGFLGYAFLSSIVALFILLLFIILFKMPINLFISLTFLSLSQCRGRMGWKLWDLWFKFLQKESGQWHIHLHRPIRQQ